MEETTVKHKVQFVLPEIRSFHPKTGEPLCVVTPGTGSIFDVKIPEGITTEKLVIVVSDLAEFHYKSAMAVQSRLHKMGWGNELIKELFYPSAEVAVADGTKPLHGGSMTEGQLRNLVLQALGTSTRFASLVQDLPIAEMAHAGPIKFDEWTVDEYEAVLIWARGEGEDVAPERVQQYVDKKLAEKEG